LTNVASLAPSATEDRPLLLRRRRDLTIVEQTYRQERYWLIKDPLELQFYRLNDSEYAVLEMLDGSRSLHQIQTEFQERFAPQRISPRELQAFILDLQRKSLLVSETPNQGHALYLLAREKSAQKLKQKFSDILAIKWRGIDPERLLGWLLPRFGWLFSAPAVIVSAAAMLGVLLLILVHHEAFTRRLPSPDQFFALQNLLMLGLVIVGTKIIHELAHGLSFKRYGGECHEIGVMWLMLVPTLYCSTTDSWLLKSKWQRAAIAAAGMYVEAQLTTLATLLWWYSQPGTFQDFCFGLMTICSVSTVLLNGNPFLKFDGYYILSDLLEIPNLRERSAMIMRDYFLRYGMGIDQDSEPLATAQTKRVLVAYGVGAKIFRAVIITTILLLMVHRLRPLGLESLGLGLGLFALSSLAVGPLMMLWKYFRTPGKLQQSRFRNLMLTAATTAALVAGSFLIPLPFRVRCSVVVQPRDAASIFAQHDGQLAVIHVKPNQLVVAGQPLLTLRNLDVDLKVARAQTQIVELQAEQHLLETDHEPNSQRPARLAEIAASLATIHAALQEYRGVQASLEVRAPRAGRVIPAHQESQRDGSPLTLVNWEGSPLHQDNLNATIRKGELLCRIGDPTELDALLVVRQSDIQHLRPGQPVEILLDSLAGRRFESSLQHVSLQEAEHIPPSVLKTHGGAEAVAANHGKTGASPSPAPATVHFFARAPLPTLEIPFSDGLRGSGKIRVEPKTLWQRCVLWTQSTFRLNL
jgi:putative peptide zinc metalloprotease protein